MLGHQSPKPPHQETLRCRSETGVTWEALFPWVLTHHAPPWNCWVLVHPVLLSAASRPAGHPLCVSRRLGASEALEGYLGIHMCQRMCFYTWWAIILVKCPREASRRGQGGIEKWEDRKCGGGVCVEWDKWHPLKALIKISSWEWAFDHLLLFFAGQEGEVADGGAKLYVGPRSSERHVLKQNGMLDGVLSWRSPNLRVIVF